MFPNPIYHDEVDQGKKWLLANLPFYSRWYRFLLFYPGSDQLLDSLFIDPSWNEGHSITVLTLHDEQLFTEAMISQISDESLIEKVIPKYPPFGKRMLQDNGAWLRTLHLPNVNLLTEGVTDMCSNGIISSGQEIELDTIIFATGFKAQEFFCPMKIDGGSGDFNKIYEDSPKSYLGITFSTMPNFFAMYGPGTNLAHAGSIIFNSECQINYICSAIEYLVNNNLKTFKVKRDIEQKYQDKFEARHEQMVWEHEKVSSWYQNSSGKVVTTSPWKLLEYWNWTKNLMKMIMNFRYLTLLIALLSFNSFADLKKPNVIIILVDDLGWADISLRGAPFKTPNIDSLFKEGVSLNRFYTTPICSPTRAALMTGRDPLKLGVASGDNVLDE